MILIRACIRLLLAVLALPLSLLAQPAASQLHFGPEYAVSDAPTLVASPNGADTPLVATNGDHFLVLWSDSRSSAATVYAARVDRTGRILDPAGIRVSDLISNPDPAQLATGMVAVWIGSSYLIAYTSYDHHDGGYSIWLARIASDGRVLARDVFFRRGTTPRFGSTGTAVLLLYRPWPGVSQFGLSAAILNDDGSVVHDRPVPSSSEALASSVAWNGQRFFAAWREPDQILGTALDAEGRAPGVLNQSLIVHSPVGFETSVASDGSRFLVAWQEFHYPRSRIRGRFVSSDGVVSGAAFFISADGQSSSRPDVTWNGSHYVVNYLTTTSSSGATALQTTTILRTGELSPASTQLTFPRPVRGVSMATAGGRTLVAWSDNRFAENQYPSQPEIFVRLIGGSESREMLLSRSHSPQNDAEAVWTGTSYLSVWTETVNPDQLQAVVSGRISRDGQPMDGPGVRLEYSSRDQRWPSVSFNGSSALVVWTERHAIDRLSIYGGRISPEGYRLDSEAFLISADAAFSPAVVGWDGLRHLVIYQNVDSARLVGQFVDATGLLDGAPFPISSDAPAGVWQRNPDLAWNGSTYLVVWERFEPYECNILCPGIPGTPAALLLTSSGAALGPAIELGPKFGGRPRVAASPTEFLVLTWESGAIFGQRVTSTGVVLDSDEESEGFLIERAWSQPQVTWTGFEYQVAFWTPDDLEVARITRQGRILDKVRLAEPRREYEGTAEITTGPAGESLLVYAKVDPRLDVRRLFARAGRATYPHRRRPARP